MTLSDANDHRREEITAKSDEKRLTCIHPAYTLAATHEDAGEVDRLMVRQFLNVLAEVALSVAGRKGAKETER